MWHPEPDPTGPHPPGKGLGLDLVNQRSLTFSTPQHSWIRKLILGGQKLPCALRLAMETH